MRVPGARVLGHSAVVRGDRTGSYCLCSCGYRSQVRGVLDASCLALTQHLQDSVRRGAPVTYGEDGGESGVREPRRPSPPPGSLSAEARPA